MADKKEKGNNDKLNTDGGTFVGGSVNTGSGDFVGRDKKVTVRGGGVYVGGDASGNTILTGDGNLVSSSTQVIFAPVYQAIRKSNLPHQEKEDLKAEIEEIEDEIIKGEEINESFLSRRLRNLRRMAPAIFDVLFAALSGPGAAVSAVVKKIAEKVKTESQSS